jgi:phosphate-selective porin OprO/OprP
MKGGCALSRKTALLWYPVMAAVLAALPAEGQSPGTEALERRVTELEERLKRMEQIVRELEARQGGPTASAVEVAAVETRRPEDTGQRTLGRENKVAEAENSAAVTAGRDGFWINSHDGDFKLNFGGYVQTDGRFYLDNPDKLGTDTFLVRRVRPSIQGTIYRNIEFRIVPDFGGGTAVVKDAYVELHYLKAAKIRAGKFKEPAGLERLQAAQDVTFQERALPDNLVPNRDVGIQVAGDVAANRLTYTIGVFNGVPDAGSVDSDSNNGKDVVMRVFATPFHNRANGDPLKGLGFGFAATIGRQEGSLSSYRTPGQVTFFSYNSGVQAAGARTRLLPQAYYYYGPLGVMFEWVRSEQRVKKDTANPVVANSGWQLAGSYYLTGEHKSYQGQPVRREFDPLRAGWGAWEVAARFEQLSVDRAIFSMGLADPTKSARQARAWAAGLNWYWNKNVKLVFNYEDTVFEGGAASGNRKGEHAVLSRFQVAF